MISNSDSWALQEFSDLNLGDKRLNNRLMKLAEDFSKHPEFSINQACKDWHATKAAYRFFQNDVFSEAEILKPHIKNTAKRCSNYNYVLAIQDTTVIGFSHHPRTTSLGNIGGCASSRSETHGLNMHSTLALTPQGMPLGLLSNFLWAPSKENKERSDRREDHLLPTEDKKSYKWINALEEVHESLKGQVKTITICDRECDIFDFYLTAKNLDSPVIVRCRDDRNIGSRSEPLNLGFKLDQTKAFLKTINIKVPIKESEKVKKYSLRYRDAELEIKSIPITLTPSRKLSQVVKEKIDLFVVEAKEINAPSGEEKAHWILTTTIPIENVEEALMIVNFYSMRWKIESYFKVLKSGCNIEKCRLGDGIRLKKYIALFSIIAWRIYWMTFINRIDPEQSCESALTENEWKTLDCYFNKNTKSPTDPPSINQAIIWLARLGGFLARKNDGDPGPTYLWRGWSRLQDMAAMREIVIQ